MTKYPKEIFCNIQAKKAQNYYFSDFKRTKLWDPNTSKVCSNIRKNKGISSSEGKRTENHSIIRQNNSEFPN